MKRPWVLIASFLLMVGCTRSSPTSQSAVSEEKTPTSDQSNRIATQPLSPEPIQIKIEDLPPPFATKSASNPPQVSSIPEQPVLKVPEGFTVNVFAEDLNNPRWLALTPAGDVLVTETRDNRIRLLKDTNGNGVADVSQVFATTGNGLDIPFGMAFSEDYFFLGNHNAVRRYSYEKGQDKLMGKGEKIADLPGGGYRQHWTRNVVLSPDQSQLYVSIGSRSNVSEESLPRASVQVMDLEGSNQETLAFGLRNPVGLDFHPETEALYTTVNERDGLGDDLVPDYLARLQQGEFYGWPYTYLKPSLLDPRQSDNGTSKKPELAAQTHTPDVLFQSHSAALGLRFYDGETFPEVYQNGAFVAFRGSWNRDRGTGYKLVFVPFNEQNRPQGYYQDFLTGFLTEPSIPRTWGRPVGLLMLPDGSLLLTEEANNRIYRVQYTGQSD